MKEEKVCINKTVGLIAVVSLIVLGVVAFNNYMGQQKVGTTPRAAGRTPTKPVMVKRTPGTFTNKAEDCFKRNLCAYALSAVDTDTAAKWKDDDLSPRDDQSYRSIDGVSYRFKCVSPEAVGAFEDQSERELKTGKSGCVGNAYLGTAYRSNVPYVCTLYKPEDIADTKMVYTENTAACGALKPGDDELGTNFSAKNYTMPTDGARARKECYSASAYKPTGGGLSEFIKNTYNGDADAALAGVTVCDVAANKARQPLVAHTGLDDCRAGYVGCSQIPNLCEKLELKTISRDASGVETIIITKHKVNPYPNSFLMHAGNLYCRVSGVISKSSLNADGTMVAGQILRCPIGVRGIAVSVSDDASIVGKIVYCSAWY